MPVRSASVVRPPGPAFPKRSCALARKTDSSSEFRVGGL
jgi:hypothetical protein